MLLKDYIVDSDFLYRKCVKEYEYYYLSFADPANTYWSYESHDYTSSPFSSNTGFILDLCGLAPQADDDIIAILYSVIRPVSSPSKPFGYEAEICDTVLNRFYVHVVGYVDLNTYGEAMYVPQIIDKIIPILPYDKTWINLTSTKNPLPSLQIRFPNAGLHVQWLIYNPRYFNYVTFPIAEDLVLTHNRHLKHFITINSSYWITFSTTSVDYEEVSKIKLRKILPIRKIGVELYAYSSASSNSGIIIEISKDGENWQEIYSIEPIPTELRRYVIMYPSGKIDENPNNDIMYLRIRAKSGDTSVTVNGYIIYISMWGTRQ